MANRITLRHGSTAPSASNLLPYELGWNENNLGLYIGQPSGEPLLISTDAKLAEYNTDEDVFQIRHAKAEKPSYNSEVVRKITGGTLAWNQLVTDANKTATVTPNGTTTYSYKNLSIICEYNHVYFVSAKITYNGSKFPMRTYTQISGGIYGRPAQDITQAGTSRYEWLAKKSNTSTQAIQIGISNIASSSKLTSDDAWTYDDANVFDLTQMFGPTIADHIYALEQATAGAGVAWFRRYFNRDYYEYNNTLANTYFDQYETTGFNQWDEEHQLGFYNANGVFSANTNGYMSSKNAIRIIPDTSYCLSFQGATTQTIYVCFYDLNGTFISRSGWSLSGGKRLFTTPSNAYYLQFSTESFYGTTYKNDICINLSDASRNGQYEPYRYSRITFFDNPVLLRGIPYLDENDNLRFNGDTLEANGKLTRRYGIVDLGTLNWTYLTTGSGVAPYFYANTSSFPQGNIKFVGNSWDVVYPIICSKYISVIRNQTYFVDKTITADGGGGVVTQIQVKDSAYTDAATFKTAMNGVYLVYELATPTEEEFTPIDGPLVSDSLGLEVIAKSDWDDTPILAQMDILYANEVRANVEMIATNKVITNITINNAIGTAIGGSY